MYPEYMIVKASEGIRNATGYLLYWTHHNDQNVLTACKVDSWKVYRTIKEATKIAQDKNPSATLYSNSRTLI